MANWPQSIQLKKNQPGPAETGGCLGGCHQSDSPTTDMRQPAHCPPARGNRGAMATPSPGAWLCLSAACSALAHTGFDLGGRGGGLHFSGDRNYFLSLFSGSSTHVARSHPGGSPMAPGAAHGQAGLPSVRLPQPQSQRSSTLAGRQRGHCEGTSCVTHPNTGQEGGPRA